MAEIAVVVHGWNDLRLALEAARRQSASLLALSAPDAVAYAGLGWFRGLIDLAGARFPDVSLAFLVDCGRRPAMAVEALRAGFALVRLDEDCPGRRAVDDIAAQCGARLLAVRPAALDLGCAADPEAALAGLRSP
jgi:hypothetical protein